MTDTELREQILATQWETPIRKVICLLWHRRSWHHFLDWETGSKRIGVAHCDKCTQWHTEAIEKLEQGKDGT